MATLPAVEAQSHPSAIYGADLLVTFPLFDENGYLLPGEALAVIVSLDGAGFVSCTNSADDIGDGFYRILLTGLETSAKVIVLTFYSGASKTTHMTIYPVRMPVLESGTAQDGSAGTITLASGASTKDSFYNGLYVLITNDSPTGARYQTRKVISYVGSTRVATVDSDWGTNPEATSSYDILIPDNYHVGANEVWNTTTRTLSSFGTLVADIATAVWAAAARTLTAFGFTVDTNPNATETAIASYLDTEISAIKAKTDTLGSGVVTVVSPVNADGTRIDIVHGDDYLSADARALEFESDSWPDLTGETVRFIISKDGKEKVNVEATLGTTGVGTQDLTVELRSTETSVLKPAIRTYLFTLRIVRDLATDEYVTLAQGVVKVYEDGQTLG